VDARQLSYFLAIVDHGGFGRAATHLHVAQPSLSHTIAGLERQLGVALFHRVGRGVVLTDTGTRLVEPARQVMRDLEAARDAVQATEELRRGRVDLVTMPSPGIEPLTTIMMRFADRFPGMSLHIDGVFTPGDVVNGVRSGTSEIGLLGSSGHPHTADLQVLHLERQPLVLISPPGDNLVETPTIRRSKLQGQRLVVSQAGSLMRQLVDEVLATGRSVHIAAEVDHRTSILPLVLAGFGHAVMPSAWEPLATRLGAVVRSITPASYLEIAIVTRASSLTPGATAFLEIARRYAEVVAVGQREPSRAGDRGS